MSHPIFRLGRIQQFDDRSKNFHIQKLLAIGVPPVSRQWPCDVWLNQGQVSSCVGNAYAHDLAAEPIMVSGVTEDTAMLIYTLAQTMDGIRGPHEGSSVLAGMKAVRKRWPTADGGYHWAFSLEDVQLALSHVGPVIFGINWYSHMYYPGPDGKISVDGKLEGGHAILGVELDMERERIWLHNSWSQLWGVNGACWLSFEDLSRLLKEGGEAMVPTDRGVITL